MKAMKIRLMVTSLCVFFLILESCTTSVPLNKTQKDTETQGVTGFTHERRPAIQKGVADLVYKKDDWALLVYITNKGSRCEGRHGVLFHEGKEVAGKLGKTLNPPIGQVRYEGSEQAKAHLWSPSGWQMIKALVKPIVRDSRPAPGSMKRKSLEEEFKNFQDSQGGN